MSALLSDILGMLTTNDAASRALHEDKLIDEEDLEERVEKIPKKILEETINVFRVKKYFTNSAWKKMQILQKRVAKEKSWDCNTCHRVLKKHEKAVGCDACLEWYHVKCTGKSEPPKAKTWVCRSCYRAKCTN